MRKSNIELLRVILMFLVIAYHYYTAVYRVSLTFLLIAFPAATAVPIFAIITGYFMVKDKRTFFVLKFFITFVYVYLINLVVASVIYGVSNGLTHDQLLDLFKFGGRDWWYLWAILIIYFLAPIINKGLALINKYYFLMMMVFFTILFFALSYFLKFEYVAAAHTTGSSVIFLLYYYLIGAGFRMYLTDYTQRYRKWIYFIAPMIILLFTIVGIIWYYTTHKDIWDWINPENIVILICSVALFTLFHEIRIKDSKIINYFASLTLVIYLFHYLFQYLMVKYKPYWSAVVDVNFIVNTLLTYGMVLVFAFPATFVLKVSTNATWNDLNKLFNFKN